MLFARAALVTNSTNTSSYIVGGTRAFLKMRSYQTQLCNYFPFDGKHFMEIYMFLFHMETNAFYIA